MRESSKKIIEELATKVNQRLNDLLIIKHPERFYEAVRWLPLAGGKRLRPIMALAVGKMLGGNEKDVMPFALALELTHNFTLVHDDIIDEDEFRRGVKTVHVAFDVPTAIIAGDTLFAMAYREISKLNVPGYVLKEVLRDFSDMVIELAEGEYEDVEFEKRTDVTTEEYLEMIRKKTARIMQTACYGAALIVKESIENAKKLGNYGLYVGLAFQIQDDILGLIGDPKITGKPVGSDIRKGKKTILVIHALNNTDTNTAKRLLEILNKPEKSDEDIKEATEIIKNAGSIDYAKDLALKYANEALKALEGYPENEYKSLLEDLAYYVVERIK